MKTPTSLILTLAACGAAGWLIPGPFLAKQVEDHPRANAAPVSRVGGKAAGASLKHRVDARLAAVREAGSASAQMAAVLSFAELSSAEEIRELLKNLHRLTLPDARKLAAAVLLRRWLELEPDAALDWCRAQREEDYASLLADHGVRHPDDAVRRMTAAYPDSRDQWSVAIMELSAGLALRGRTEKAWELLGKVSDSWTPHISMPQVIRLLAAENPDFLSSLPENARPQLEIVAGKVHAERLAERDPARALEWILRQPHPRAFIDAAMSQVVRRDPAEALRLLSGLPEELASAAAGSGEFSCSVDLEKAGEFVRGLEETPGLSEKNKSTMAVNLFQRLMRKEPLLAARLLNFMDEGDRAGNITHLGESWKSRDPEAAAVWMTGLSPKERMLAEADGWETFSHPKPANLKPDDPPEAFAAAASAGQTLSRTLLQSLTLEQFTALENAPSGDSFFGGGLTGRVQQINPRVFGEWLAAGGDDGVRPQHVAQFSARWAHEAPHEAAEWVSGSGAGKWQATAAENVARQYALFDPVNATAWAESLADPAAREAALKGLEKK